LGLHWHVPTGQRERALARWQSYTLRDRHPDAPLPTYGAALFAALPIHNLAVIQNHDGGVNENTLERAKQSGLAVRVAQD
jgi:hypothetical protein